LSPTTVRSVTGVAGAAGLALTGLEGTTGFRVLFLSPNIQLLLADRATPLE
jgi:hypothetical protein